MTAPTSRPSGESLRRRVRATIVAIVAIVATALGGCAVFSSPDREYSSNERVLAAIESRLDYRVPRSEYRLVRAEVNDDCITLHYLGVAVPGDQAWVVRFSEKSTELAPERLSTVAPAIAIISEEGLQPGFAASTPAENVVAGVRIESATYTFRSSIAPTGRTGRGIIAAVRTGKADEPVVYQIKLDNHGDRVTLGPEHLAPFLIPLAN